ncbi:hypothetical protein NQ318_016640 [Aromia moschata]|uniref:Uncharacterized protein n=1 Tax=Aromia moschata TaxID=1265417 RepID=A0AAV8XTE7_9CUCU|nr:hypothetical protein NQ318_016640 [Aromia moschata]
MKTKNIDGAPAVASARQFLPAVPGYVPVYIRNGDTPLEEINPDLAEAFSSYSQKHARYTYVRSNNAIADKTETEVKDSLEVAPDVKDVTLEEDVKDVTLEEDVNDAREQIQASRSQHIQKIPRP